MFFVVAISAQNIFDFYYLFLNVFYFRYFSSKHSETSRSNRSTPVKKPTRLVSYIDPEDDDDVDRTLNDVDVDEGDDDQDLKVEDESG